MTRLMMVIFSMAATTLMGTFMVVALVMGMDTLKPILVAVALGFVAAMPVTYFVTRRLA